MYFVNPKDQERFALRLLLLYKKGATSFEDLKTIDNHRFDTFKQAVQALGFLDDDQEWDKCLSEAASYQTRTGELRELFSTILLQCNPTNSGALWEKHKFNLSEDILQHIRNQKKDYTIPLDQRMIDLTLHLINLNLKKNGKSIKDYPELPAYDISTELYEQLEANNLINSERSYDVEVLKKELIENLPKLNSDQKKVYDTINKTIQLKNEGLFLITCA